MRTYGSHNETLMTIDYILVITAINRNLRRYNATLSTSLRFLYRSPLILPLIFHRSIILKTQLKTLNLVSFLRDD